MIVKMAGTLKFEPEDKTRKHRDQASWKRIAMICTDDDLSEYYAWFIYKRFNLVLNKPIRGAHLTIVNDAERDFKFGPEPHWEWAKEKYDSKPMDFYIDIEPRTNGEHWWFRAYCPEAENLREELGLNREPFYTLHLTIGYANSKNLFHSEYILSISKLHGILSSEGRQPMESHELRDYTI